VTAPRERPTLALAAGGHALCHGAKVALPLVTVSVAADEFGVGIGRIGLAITVFTLAMAATSVPAGLAGDRWGTARVLALFFWLTGIAATCCAVSRDFTPFLLSNGLLGAAAGLFHPAALGLLSFSYPKERLGPAMGLFGVVGNVGIVLMPLAVATPLGWRAGFLLLGLAAFVGAGACHLMLARGMLLPGRPAGVLSAEARPAGGGRTGLLFLLLAMGVNAFMLDGFMPLFPETVSSFGTLFVGNAVLMAAVLAVGALGQWTGGQLARDAFASVRYAMLLLAQPLVLLGLAQTLAEPAWPYMLMAIFVCVNFMTQPIENRLLAAYTSTRRRSTAYAFKFVVALAISSPAPWLVTLLYKSGWSFGPLYRLLAMLGMVGVFAGWLFLRGMRRPSPAR
jgi:predicted MFS family arabinose efflux permease